MIELRRGRTRDVTVGQNLRYMGWVEEHLAGEEQLVEGLLVSQEIDAALRYAVSQVSGVTVLTYPVDFCFQVVCI